MKKILTILLSILSLILVAQTPQKFNFQAVARNNSSGATLGNEILPTISVSISQNPDGSSAVFSENFTNVKTAPFGMFSLSIGTGTVTFGTFNTINWGSGTWYLKVQIGSPIDFNVTTQLLSVPYALYAEESKIKFVDAIQTGSHSSTNRAAWFSLTNAPLQVTVPASGTYLVLAKLRASVFTNNDKIAMSVSKNGAAPFLTSYVFVATGQAGSSDIGDRIGSAHWVTSFSKGDVLNLQARISNAGGVSTSTVIFEDGEFSIFKLQ